MDYKRLGMRIKQARLNARMTQERLAEKIEMSAVYISQIENGSRKLSIDTLLRIANVLNISTDSLLRDGLSIDDNDAAQDFRILIEGLANEDRELLLNLIRIIAKRIKKN